MGTLGQIQKNKAAQKQLPPQQTRLPGISGGLESGTTYNIPPQASSQIGSVSGNAEPSSSGNIEIQGTPLCAGYYVVSDTGETRTSPRKFSFGIRNTCSFPVYISWNGYFNNVETQSIDYSILLKRGTSSRPVFGPGDKIEAVPFNIGAKKEFHAKIHSVCPTEDEASRITGKTIAYVAKGDGGMCIAKILDTRGVSTSK